MVVNTARVCRVISIRLVRIERRIIGSVTYQNRRSPPAPSMLAASSISGGMSESAAE